MIDEVALEAAGQEPWELDTGQTAAYEEIRLGMVKRGARGEEEERRSQKNDRASQI